MAALARSIERREAAKQGQIVDPSLKSRGVGNKAGRPKAKTRGYEKTHKPLAAPVLRRDPPAPEKLQIIGLWEQALREEGCKKVSELPSRRKRDLEATWHWKYETVARWFELKTALQETVSSLRLGLRGLRPFA